jgi:hypothetical protein
MKSATVALFFLMAVSLILAACSNAATVVPSPSSSTQLPIIISSPPPITTSESTITLTAIQIPCNPSVAVYCVENAYFVLQPPIPPSGIDSIDRSYPYGSTKGGTRDPHHGVEFYNASGTPVLAAADGLVYYAGDDTTRKFSPWSGFYGNIVVLKHPLSGTPFDSLYTLYAHLSTIMVSNGQTIISGEKIGEVGLTGTASGSHLHFEVRIDPNDYGSTLNPDLWLEPHSGNGTLALLATDKTGVIIFPSFNVQYFPDRNKPATAAHQVYAYAPETVVARDPWKEIAAIGDQRGGWYRVTFLWAGGLYEKWVEIHSGKLTILKFTVE